MVEERIAEIKATHLLEEGKGKLAEREFDKARELIAKANGYFHKSTLTLAVLGLGIAPKATGKLISFWSRVRSGVSA